MQYVNDDMDELFRSAAEDYPLDTNSADWNKVLTALQGETEIKTVSEKKKNNNSRLLWLLLLLPLGLICNRLYSPGVFNGKEVSNANEVSKAFGSKNVYRQDKGDDDVNRSGATVTNNANRNLDDSKVENSFVPSVSKKISYSSNAIHSKNTINNYNSEEVVFSNNSVTKNNETFSNDLSTDKLFHQRQFVSAIDFQNQIPADFKTAVNKTFNPSLHSSEENTKQIIHVQRRKKFYAGVVGGIDATTIKFQKVQNAGATYGLQFGYQLNKKWSIETEALLEKKYYYTEGKYFNTSKIPIPQSWTIDKVSGNCKMIEVPVSVKYNFSLHKNSNWFATVGSSSYFMKKQNYTYDYYYGNWGPYTSNKSYDTSSAYFFSNLSLSVGYSHRLGNFGDVRVEPYLKLPVSGIGMGSLPLFSTGIQIGITKKF